MVAMSVSLVDFFVWVQGIKQPVGYGTPKNCTFSDTSAECALDLRLTPKNYCHYSAYFKIKQQP
jgi:hypothetical protein